MVGLRRLCNGQKCVSDVSGRRQRGCKSAVQLFLLGLLCLESLWLAFLPGLLSVRSVGHWPRCPWQQRLVNTQEPTRTPLEWKKRAKNKESLALVSVMSYPLFFFTLCSQRVAAQTMEDSLLSGEREVIWTSRSYSSFQSSLSAMQCSSLKPFMWRQI